jgi:Skp family chaperone for outer membrane proteins
MNIKFTLLALLIATPTAVKSGENSAGVKLAFCNDKHLLQQYYNPISQSYNTFQRQKDFEYCLKNADELIKQDEENRKKGEKEIDGFWDKVEKNQQERKRKEEEQKKERERQQKIRNEYLQKLKQNWEDEFTKPS